MHHPIWKNKELKGRKIIKWEVGDTEGDRVIKTPGFGMLLEQGASPPVTLSEEKPDYMEGNLDSCEA